MQEYGGEGSEAELREAAEVVHGFYVARAEGKWAEACGYVSESLKVRMAKAAPALKEVDGTSCVAFLEGFTADLTPAEWREVTTVDAGSLRHEDDRAFLLYYGSEGKAYTMPLLSDEGGEWKVNALAPVALR